MSVRVFASVSSVLRYLEETPMKTIACSAAMILALASAAPAQDKPGVVAADIVDAVLTVRGVNYAQRLVTFATSDGEVSTIKVPDEAQNLDQVYAGARFKVRYVESVVIGVAGVATQPAASDVQTVELAPKGETPGGTIVNVKQVTARVEAIDYAARMIAVRGPLGGLRHFDVGPEVQRFDNIRVGDTVVLRYTEALGLKMIKE
jgi:hypothetical protein